jgi:hypothetical protein
MSNLHCPNCDHLIGTLKPAELPVERAARDASTWALAVGWDGWQTSGEVYRQYSEWAAERGLEVPTKRMLTTALVAGGAKSKTSNRGRLYARS